MPAILWFIIIFVSAVVIKSFKNNPIEYKYYIPNILAKLFFGVFFGLFYLIVYGGGDTTAYFEGALALNNLFFKSPELYFKQMLTAPEPSQYSVFYDSTTGYPPTWIFRETAGFFISKIASIFAFFTLKSYFAMTLFFATFTAHASWKIYQLVRSYNFSSNKLLVFGVLFLPSVNFWCSGVSKDSVVFAATLYTVYNAFIIISPEHKSKIINYIIITVMVFLIYHIRSFVLIAIFVPLFFAISARFVRFLGGGNMAVVAFRSIILIIGIVGIGRSFILQSEEDFLSSNSALQQAEITQRDFQFNETYGDKKYDLGDVEFTSIGLLKVMPLAMLTGIFRPFIWEALSPSLLMNGLESIIFLYFTFFFVRKKLISKLSLIRGHEFLIFCLIFVLIIGFLTGLTSILYGVLVRLRAPLLPFLFILLTMDMSKMLKTKLSIDGK